MTTPASLLQRTVAIAATTVVGGLALMFSAIFFVIILSIAAVAWTYLMWKTHELRKQMRNIPTCDASLAHEEFEGEVIEAEVIRMDESKIRNRG